MILPNGSASSDTKVILSKWPVILLRLSNSFVAFFLQISLESENERLLVVALSKLKEKMKTI